MVEVGRKCVQDCDSGMPGTNALLTVQLKAGSLGIRVLNSHLSCPTWLNERILDLSSNWVC